MKPLAPALAAVAIFTFFGALAWFVARCAAWLEIYDRRTAIRLHSTGWSVGQIAHRQFRDPAQIAGWLAEADPRRPS